MNTIPKVFHQIWIGTEDSVPVSYKILRDHTLNLHPDWDYKLWLPEDFLPLINQDSYDYYKAAMYRADVARYEIMALNGGVYLDWDFYIFRNIEPLIRETDNFIIAEPMDLPVNSVFGLSPNHWFAWRLVRELRCSAITERTRLMGGAKNPLHGVGARYFSKQVLECEDRLNILPRSVFTPYSYSYFKCGRWDYRPVRGGYGIHLWNSTSTPTIFSHFVRQLDESKNYKDELDAETRLLEEKEAANKQLELRRGERE